MTTDKREFFRKLLNERLEALVEEADAFRQRALAPALESEE